MNPLVHIDQVSGFMIRVTNVINDGLSGTSFEFSVSKDSALDDVNSNVIQTTIPSINLRQITQNLMYHIQIAYIDTVNDIGTYSTAALVKYTAEPELSIHYATGNITFKGTYITTDVNESLYSYQFIIVDKNGNEFDNSGILIHNSQNNKLEKDAGQKITSVVCENTYTTYKTFDTNASYEIIYKTISMNNLQRQVKSDTYTTASIIEPSSKIKISATYDRDNACVHIQSKSATETFIPGTFKLVRACSKDNYKSWTPIKSIKLLNPNGIKFIDYTIEQGLSYQYGYQQYNDKGLHSLIDGISDIIYADFEYMYLADKTRQIKLSFNSKVSSFKTTLFENKLDTLGGKYPFFLRNGDQEYKEFPISGLISYQLDDKEIFMTRDKLGLSQNNEQRTDTESNAEIGYVPTTNQVGYNFIAERLFRLELLDWLNNGEPKLFRSPAEGNYMVRLMNVSLTPNEQLSRLISDFSATAYECGRSDLSAIVEEWQWYTPDNVDEYYYNTETQEICENTFIELEDGKTFERISITGAFPGSQIELTYQTSPTAMSKIVATYTVGPLGTLEVTNLPAANTMRYIYQSIPIGTIIYTYKQQFPKDSEFDNYESIDIKLKAKTLSSGTEYTVTQRIVDIYTFICEPEQQGVDASVSINNEIIHLNGVMQFENPSFLLTPKENSIFLTNAKAHIYYKYYTIPNQSNETDEWGLNNDDVQ